MSNSKAIVSAFFFAFLGISTSFAQTHNPVALYGPTSPIVRIGFQDIDFRGVERANSRMGFVVGKNLVATVMPEQMMQSDHPIVSVSFTTTYGSIRRPIASFKTASKIVAVDHSQQLALLAVDTADAKPIVLASELKDGEALYLYMEASKPNKNSFRRADTIYTIVAVPQDGFSRVLGSPVLNARGEAVGVISEWCDEGMEQKKCIASTQKLRQLISSVGR